MTTDRNSRMAPIPVPMPIHLIQRLEEAAYNIGMTSRSAFIRFALESYLAQNTQTTLQSASPALLQNQLLE